MISRVLDAGTPAAWVTGDEVYGADPGLRADLERRKIGYVLAVAVSHPSTRSHAPTPANRRASGGSRTPRRSIPPLSPAPPRGTATNCSARSGGWVASGRG